MSAPLRLSQAELHQLIRLAVIRDTQARDHQLACDADDWARLAVRYWRCGEVPTRLALWTRWYAGD